MTFDRASTRRACRAGSPGPPGERLRSEYLPALSDRAVDPLGCGDALLAAATLTLAAGGSLPAAALIGSAAAAVEVEQVGNVPVTAEAVADRLFLSQSFSPEAETGSPDWPRGGVMQMRRSCCALGCPVQDRNPGPVQSRTSGVSGGEPRLSCEPLPPRAWVSRPLAQQLPPNCNRQPVSRRLLRSPRRTLARSRAGPDERAGDDQNDLADDEDDQPGERRCP